MRFVGVLLVAVVSTFANGACVDAQKEQIGILCRRNSNSYDASVVLNGLLVEQSIDVYASKAGTKPPESQCYTFKRPFLVSHLAATETRLAPEATVYSNSSGSVCVVLTQK